MTTEVLIIGAGGHAAVVADALLASGHRVRGFIDSSAQKQGTSIFGLPVLGGDELLDSLSPADVQLANGIGSAGVMDARCRVYTAAVSRGFAFVSVRHPSAIVATSAVLGVGSQVLARAVVQPFATIGENSIINTGAIVEHDVVVGAHSHISPGCVLAGQVTVGTHVHVGVGAVVKQGINIAERSLVAAGAVVVDDVAAGTTVLGVPARVKK
jgi:sugar O-acyltransferase (sialic acid O-acetyltransferase NeuD family)